MRSAIGATALLALLLSGCAGIPTSGGVEAGDVLGGEADSEIVFGPAGPQPGAEQDDILTGFLQAAVSPQRNYEVARSFLTGERRQDWNPNAVVLLREDAGSAARLGDETLAYSFSSSASIDANGIYTEQRVPARQTIQVEFERNDDGEWRISEVPDGIIVSEASFDAVFDPYPLWYYDPSFAYLVPDLRWFASGRPNVAAAVVAELLDGPAPYLSEGAVVGAFPPGTESGDVVVTAEGAATVDLTAEAAGSGAAARERMRRQLTETLRGFTVTGVEITVEGVPLPVAEGSGGDAVASPAVEDEPLVLRDGEFGFAEVASLRPVPLSDQLATLQPSAVAYSSRTDVAAALTARGVVLVRDGSSPLLLDGREGLVAPTLDPLGFVWTARADEGTSIQAVDFAGGVHAIRSGVSPDSRIVSISVSRDGTRMLLYLETPAGPQLSVRGVVREDAVPVALTSEQLRLPVGEGAARDAAWVGESAVAALSGGSTPQVGLFELGGPSRSLGLAPGAVALEGSNGGVSGIRVLADGLLLQYRGNAWLPTGIPAELIAEQH